MDKSINVLTKGMNMDIHPIHHQEDTTSFTLNGIYSNSVNGDVFTMQNENGNELCFTLPDDLKLLGSISIGRTESFIVAANDDIVTFGIADNKQCSYEEIVRTSCIKFTTASIKGLFRIIQSDSRVVYIYNGVDRDIAINIDSLDDYTAKYDTVTNDGKLITTSYTIEQANELDQWDCNTMYLESDRLLPCIEQVSINNSGGSLIPGMYQFVAELLDSDDRSVGFGMISQPVTIYPDFSTNNWNKISGAYEESESFTTEIGAKAVNKSIQLTLGNLDNSFTKYRIHVIDPNKTVTALSPTTNNVITYDGTSSTLSSIESVKAIKLYNEASASMEIVDGRLLRANLKGLELNWGDFQRTASTIKTTWISKDLSAQDQSISGNSKSSTTSFESMSYMGDEIYPHAIVYQFKQGFDSPAFHIPGRPLNRSVSDCELLTCKDPLNQLCLQVTGQGLIVGQTTELTVIAVTYTVNGESFTSTVEFAEVETVSVYCGQLTDDIQVVDFEIITQSSNISPSWNIGIVTISNCPTNDTIPVDASGDQWDDTIITEWSEDLIPFGYPDEASYNGELLRWEVYNTATSEGQLAYYACKDECYPDIRDCNGEPIWGTDACGNSLVNTPIRHIKLPDRALVPHVDSNGENIVQLGLSFDNISYPHPDIIGHKIVRVEHNQNTRTVTSTGWNGHACNLDDRVGISYWQNQDASTYNDYLSAETLIGKEIPGGTYVKSLLSATHASSEMPETIVAVNDNDYGVNDYDLRARTRFLNVFSSNDQSHYAIEDFKLINPVNKQFSEKLELVHIDIQQLNRINLMLSVIYLIFNM